MVRHDTFTISRHLDGPPGEVFTAFADTAIRRRWWRLPGSETSYEHDFQVGGGETARSTFTGLETAPEQLEYRSRYIDIAGTHRIVYGYEAVVDGELRWTSLVTVRLEAETDGTRLEWTEQVTFVRFAGDGDTELAHLRGGERAAAEWPRRGPAIRTQASATAVKVRVGSGDYSTRHNVSDHQ